ncbi:hypothetical protein SISSUDRAFT_1064736 [Sistotremastrum suecicum HHB10207 ss-3]|uniref:F-box domain-containing protein n=1 Tax=Sistotremastrum suecicum HHB10207 ss-3 TaxID=1314776 RepID=A0A166AAJ4_9AGAM|nr:hypothetical protein SISSUDRAFT_1064736 [Sistotremastrum suecicum HHB10207 ss-3]
MHKKRARLREAIWAIILTCHAWSDMGLELLYHHVDFCFNHNPRHTPRTLKVDYRYSDEEEVPCARWIKNVVVGSAAKPPDFVWLLNNCHGIKRMSYYTSVVQWPLANHLLEGFSSLQTLALHGHEDSEEARPLPRCFPNLRNLLLSGDTSRLRIDKWMLPRLEHLCLSDMPRAVADEALRVHGKSIQVLLMKDIGPIDSVQTSGFALDEHCPNLLSVLATPDSHDRQLVCSYHKSLRVIALARRLPCYNTENKNTSWTRYSTYIRNSIPLLNKSNFPSLEQVELPPDLPDSEGSLYNLYNEPALHLYKQRAIQEKIKFVFTTSHDLAL